MDWEQNTFEKFNLVLARIPVFHRRIAESAVKNQSEDNARLRNADTVQEEDLVGAFFLSVPKPFYSMMVRLLEEARIDYRKYGFPHTRGNSV